MGASPLILAIGEILWDLLPSGKELGGAPANFAWHSSQLGARAIPVSAVGDDPLGCEILTRLDELGLDRSHIAIDPAHRTGTVDVVVDAAGQPSYTIHENVAWDFFAASNAVMELAAQADCFCFGSLAQRSEVSRRAIQAILSAARPDALRIFDINLRQKYYSREVLEPSLRLATVLKINDQEMPVLLELLEPRDKDAGADAIFDRFASLELIALTRGAWGSVLVTRDGRRHDHPGVAISRENLADTVGAGDSFTAALAMGLLRDLPLERINAHANRLAAFVCTRPGATPVIPSSFRPELIAR